MATQLTVSLWLPIGLACARQAGLEVRSDACWRTMAVFPSRSTELTPSQPRHKQSVELPSNPAGVAISTAGKNRGLAQRSAFAACAATKAERRCATLPLYLRVLAQRKSAAARHWERFFCAASSPYPPAVALASTRSLL